MSQRDSEEQVKTQAESHALDDHNYGTFGQHQHVPGQHYDHDHDDEFDDSPLEDNPLWQQDNIFLSTVGIDIGSSSTQVVFSQVHLERQGEALSSRYVVVKRRLIYQSPIFFTPYTDGNQIDPGALGACIDQAYNEADLRPYDIDIGVVLLTGEALRRDNSEQIAHLIAHKGGEFLSASAGHHMESVLAAHGSGAVAHSGTQGQRVLNVDIGGGTTKLALIDSGQVTSSAAFHVGGRLLVIDAEGTITRLEPRLVEIARSIGMTLHLGVKVDPTMMAKIATEMARMVVDVLCGRAVPEATWLTDPLDLSEPMDAIVFSGGVSEYIREPEQTGHGDIGLALGQAIRSAIDASALPAPVVPADQGIRATALGASEFNIQVSGNTGHISDPGALLPRRNLPVISVRVSAETATRASVCAMLDTAEAHFDLVNYSECAIAMSWDGYFDYPALRALCEGVRDHINQWADHHRPLYLLFDRDLAQSVGRILVEELDVTRPILVLDGLVFRAFEFVDLGRIRLPSRTVPVTVKSLLFQNHGMAPKAHEESL